MKALFIPVDGPPRELDLPGGGTRFMRSLKALIGTECAERIWVTSRWEAWLDEDGAATGKPVNQAATLVARSFGFEFSLHGAVVIVGVDKDSELEQPGRHPGRAILRLQFSLHGAVVIVGVDKDTAGRRPCRQPRPGPYSRRSGHSLPDVGLVEATMQHGRESEHVQGVAARGRPGHPGLGTWAAGLRKVLNSPFRYWEMAGGRQP